MTGSYIASLYPIVAVLYKPNGEVRSFLTDHGSGIYSLYCKEIRAYGMSLTAEQVEEFQELLKSPIKEPSKDELQKY